LQFCRNSVVAKNSQPINRRYITTSTNRNAVSLSWRRTALHANRLLPPLPMLTDVNNNKRIDFRAILLPEVTANKIYTYYGTT